MPNKSAKYYMSKALTVLAALRCSKHEEIIEMENGNKRQREILWGQIELLDQLRHIMSDPEVLHAYFRMAVSNKPLSVPRHSDTLRELKSMLANCEDDAMKAHIQIVIDRLQGD